MTLPPPPPPPPPCRHCPGWDGDDGGGGGDYGGVDGVSGECSVPASSCLCARLANCRIVFVRGRDKCFRLSSLSRLTLLLGEPDRQQTGRSCSPQPNQADTARQSRAEQSVH